MWKENGEGLYFGSLFEPQQNGLALRYKCKRNYKVCVGITRVFVPLTFSPDQPKAHDNGTANRMARSASDFVRQVDTESLGSRGRPHTL